MQILRNYRDLFNLLSFCNTYSKKIKESGGNVKTFTALRSNNENKIIITQTEEDINNTIQDHKPNYFIIGGELSLFNDKKNKNEELIMLRSYHNSLPNCYVFMQRFTTLSNNTIQFNGDLLFATSEENNYFPQEPISGEESNTSAFNLPSENDNEYKAVIMIGHLDETRLFNDLQTLIINTLNKVSRAPHLNHHFIFEISKYGSMTQLFKDDLKSIKEYTLKHILPIHNNITIEFNCDELIEH